MPKTQQRVRENTDEQINLKIQREIETRVFFYADHPELIDTRISELEKEWDIERVLEANAAGISLFGIAMGSRNCKWLVLPFAVAGFLLQHALQGWCPPVPVFRRMGIRTTAEINKEKNALKALRKDYAQLDHKKPAADLAAAALEAASL